MTNEEKLARAAYINQRGNQLSEQYLPYLNPEMDETMEEIFNLSLLDIILIHSKARGALENGIFEGVNPEALDNNETSALIFNDSINLLRKLIIKKIKKSESLWIIKDNITDSIYIDEDDTSFIFPERIDGEDCLSYFKNKGRLSFELYEVTKENIKEFFFTATHLKGVRYYEVGIGDVVDIFLYGDEVSKKPDYSELDEFERPIENPDLYRCLCKWQQEVLANGDYEGKEEKIGYLEEAMVEEFKLSRFLVPAQGLENLVNNSGEGVVIPYIEKEGENGPVFYTPVFTDWKEFNKMYSQDEYKGWIWEAQDLKLAPTDNIIIDGYSLAFEVTKEILEKIFAEEKTQ